MKRWFLFVVFLGISSSMMASYLGTSVPSPCQGDIDTQLPKLVVEEVQLEVSREAPVHIYDLSYTVDPANVTFTLTSKNYAIDKLGFKLISQKTGEIKPDVITINNKQIQLNLSKVPKGTYYLRLCQKSGDIVKIYRLIKAQ